MTASDEEVYKISKSVFNEFRERFSALSEDHAETRLILAGMGATVAATQERIERELKDIASALRESITSSNKVEKLEDKISQLEERLNNKRERIILLEKEEHQLSKKLNEEDSKIKRESILIKVILIALVAQTILLLYHLFL